MHRRSFLTLLGGAAAAWPIAARAQQKAMPIVGYLYLGSPEMIPHLVEAFRKGLSEAGYVDGRNVTIKFFAAHNNSARLLELAAEAVRENVAVIFAPGAMAPSAAKAATSTIPVVFSSAIDPVQTGLVPRLNRPGGIVTGITYMSDDLATKRLGILHELLPRAEKFAFLLDPNDASSQRVTQALQGAASDIARSIAVISASSIREIDSAFARIGDMKADGLITGSGTLFLNRRVQIATLATRHGIPTMFGGREFAEIGGLMSYGTNIAEQTRLGALYVARILKGEKPADLPVMRPTKFELVINLGTARALGIEVPPTLLAIADEVIE